jgi:hypothetical protein
LLTDGAARAADLFGLLAWPQLLDVIEESGPAELIRLVRNAEFDDRNETVRSRFKRHAGQVRQCRLKIVPKISPRSNGVNKK